MGKTVRQQIERAYQQLLKRHGIEGDDAKKALELITERGYSNHAAIRLVQNRGDHRVLLQGR